MAKLPNIKEVEKWDREHRRECQEYHCTLAHRMLAFADWYILLADELEKRHEVLRVATLELLNSGGCDTFTPRADEAWMTLRNIVGYE